VRDGSLPARSQTQASVCGTAPRSNGDARYQFRKNFDLVLAKDVRLKGGRSAEFRMEILNLTNTAKFAGPGEFDHHRRAKLRQHRLPGWLHADLSTGVSLPLQSFSDARTAVKCLRCGKSADVKG
jgi:hypothetical protein